MVMARICNSCYVKKYFENLRQPLPAVYSSTNGLTNHHRLAGCSVGVLQGNFAMSCCKLENVWNPMIWAVSVRLQDAPNQIVPGNDQGGPKRLALQNHDHRTE